MKTSDFNYYLPKELIAQVPLEKRDTSKLMVLDKETGKIEHKVFTDILDYLEKGDTLVLNNTKVIPARIYASRENKEENIEVLLLKDLGKNKWQVLAKPGKKLQIGTLLNFSNIMKAKVIEILEDGQRIIEFNYEGIFIEKLEEIGSMPLPPYITEKLEDKNRYQTVYSKELGSAAAPTAGLHFTDELIEKIKEKGINIVFVTLHVGLGTFRPVKVEDVLKHKMHSEYYEISEETAKAINETKKRGNKIICVGTTSCRTLEAAIDEKGKVKAQKNDTEIFIYPGYKFKVVDKLITNFHLPESTLIMLVSALAGKDNVMNAYEEAVNKKYRFFSFGDAMYIK
ncbi:MAG: tRNA preQ1(34) S-adenosylmethionine ribosyltransferase-isomerase QueA [Clostridia bacterium]|nr:tRNA preQ1(34) S-adenosylmethionine ribosyltransferase-isomerase QueA [Clostridia bacterium]